jgi:tetratricopeptide (TPR) repeat protein
MPRLDRAWRRDGAIEEREHMANLGADGRFDRRTALDNAQRLVQQNKLSRAIGAYEQLTREDPRDWASANTFGDLLVRANRTDQAILEYLRVAHHLTDAGFLARAGAIYKKVLRLEPAHVEALRGTESLNIQRFATPGDPAKRGGEGQVRVDPAPAAAASVVHPMTPETTGTSTHAECDDRPDRTWSLDQPDPSLA